MAETTKKYYGKQYFHLFHNFAIFLIGYLVLIHTFDYESFGLWFPLTAIILGILLLGGGGIGTAKAVVEIIRKYRSKEPDPEAPDDADAVDY